jgi:hypothetical protein
VGDSREEVLKMDMNDPNFDSKWQKMWLKILKYLIIAFVLFFTPLGDNWIVWCVILGIIIPDIIDSFKSTDHRQ